MSSLDVGVFEPQVYQRGLFAERTKLQVLSTSPSIDLVKNFAGFFSVEVPLERFGTRRVFTSHMHNVPQPFHVRHSSAYGLPA